MTERRGPRYRVAEELEGTFAILDASNTDGVLVGGIRNQATACNIVTALNLNWRITLIAAGELAVNSAGALDPAIGTLVRASRNMLKEFNERDALSEIEFRRQEHLRAALEPFKGLEADGEEDTTTSETGPDRYGPALVQLVTAARMVEAEHRFTGRERDPVISLGALRAITHALVPFKDTGMKGGPNARP